MIRRLVKKLVGWLGLAKKPANAPVDSFADKPYCRDI